MSTVSIRAAGLPLASLLSTLHGESFGVEGWSYDQIRGSLALTTTKAWIAHQGDVPAGFILCQIAGEEAEILTLCVRPAERRKSVAGLLLRHAIKEMRAAGASIILLEVAADNSAARKLYEQSGFAITGTRANYYKRGALTVDAVMYGFEVEARGQGFRFPNL